MLRTTKNSNLIVALPMILAPMLAQADQPIVSMECQFLDAAEIENDDRFKELLEKIPKAIGVGSCSFGDDVDALSVVEKIEVEDGTRIYWENAVASYADIEFETTFLKYFQDPENFTAWRQIFACIDERHCDQPYDRGFVAIEDNVFFGQQKALGVSGAELFGLIKEFWKSLPLGVESFVVQHPNRKSAKDLGKILTHFFDPAFDQLDTQLTQNRESQTAMLLLSLRDFVWYEIEIDNLSEQKTLDIRKCSLGEFSVDDAKSDPGC